MKLALFLLQIIVFAFPNFGQQYSYAWFTDTHIGAPGAEEDLLAAIERVNALNDISFTVITGDITEKGRDAELSKAKEILAQLKKPYYIIPGNHDTKWSESGCTAFSAEFGDNKFIFSAGGDIHIGVNSGILLRGGGGHIEPETLTWLDSVLAYQVQDQKIYFYVHHPLDGDVDNWFKVTNLLRNKNIAAVFCGHGHANKAMSFNGIPAVMARSTLQKKIGQGFTIVKAYSDSLEFYEMRGDSLMPRWHSIITATSLDIPLIDSLQYSAEGVNTISFVEESNTQNAPLLAYDNKVYAVSYSGIIRCYSQDGELIWKYETGNKIVAQPAAEAGILVVGTLSGDIITFNANTGEYIQSIGIDERVTSKMTIIPAEYQNEKTYAVVFGTNTGALYCYDIFYLGFLWKNTSASMMIESKPLFTQNRIVFGSWDNYLYCIDSRSGTLNWKWTENKNFYYSPAAANPVTDGKYVFISTPDKFVSAIDLLLGTTVWRKADYSAWESIGITDSYSRLIIKSMNSKVYIVDPKNGKKITEIDGGFGLDTMPVQLFGNGTPVLIPSKNGFLYQITGISAMVPVAFLGTARLHSVCKINETKFAVSSMDGAILFFSLRM